LGTDWPNLPSGVENPTGFASAKERAEFLQSKT